MKKHLLKMMMPVLFGAALVLTGCPTNPTDQPYKPIEPDAETMAAKIVGNCKQNFSDSYLGNGLQGIAAKLSADKLKDQGGRFRAIRVDVGAEATDCEVFIAKGDIDNVVARQEFTPDGKGWYYVEISYEYGYNEDESDFYIGMTCNTPSGVYPVGIQTANRAYSTEYIMANNKWMKLSEAGVGGYVSIQAVIDGGDYSQESDKYDLAIDVTAPASLKDGEANVAEVTVANMGINKVSGATLAITCDGQQSSQPVSQQLLPGQSAVVSVTLPSVTAGAYKKSYTVEIVATANEGSNASDDNKYSFVQQIYSLTGEPRNAVVVEQFTSVGCGYCPEGSRALQNAIDAMDNPEKVIWVANHNHMNGTDPFYMRQCDTLMNWFGVTGYPMIMLNRSYTDYGLVFGPTQVTTDMLTSALNSPTAVTLDMTREYNASTRELNVTVSGKSTFESNLLITVLVLQNGLNYSQIDYEYNTTHTDYDHNNVPRVYLTKAIGSDLTVTDGAYSWTGTVTIPEKVDDYECVAEDMNVVAYVSIDGADVLNVDVMNAAKLSLVEGTTPDEPENPDTDVEPEGVLKYVAPMYRANALVTEVE